jgi:hypothetical protein
MHRAGVDNLGRLQKSRIAFQRHTALGAITRGIALYALAHGAKVFLLLLACLHECRVYHVIVLMLAAAGMCGRIMVSVRFHPLNCTLLEVKCRAARLQVLAKRPARVAI